MVALVASGVASGVDQFAVSHLMPWLEPRRRPVLTVSSLTLPRRHGPLGNVLLGLWTYPAAVAPSLVLVVLCARRLARRDGLALCALWLAGNLAEVVGKLTVTRPDLSSGDVHVVAFDNSLPSGHTIRSLVLAGAVALALPAFGRLMFVWAFGVLVALVVGGAHTPTDVAAGVLVAAVLTCWAPSGFGSLKWGTTPPGWRATTNRARPLKAVRRAGSTGTGSRER
jgi:membrane-associated phospholipid phosphatase